MADIVEINVATGEKIERDFTPEELSRLEEDRIRNEEIALQVKAKYDEDIAERNDIIERFLSMGFTEAQAEKMSPPVFVDDRIRHLL